MKDNKTISNAPHEIRTAAKTLNVPEYVILYAKHITGSNEREKIYDWVKTHKGVPVTFTI